MDNTNFDKKNVLKQAAMYFREGQWDKALDEHGKILAQDRNDPDSLAAVGDIYTKKKSAQMAYEFYNKAIPFFLIQNRSEDAIQTYQKITRLDLEKLSADVRMNISIFKLYIEIDEILKDKRYEIAIAPIGKLLKLRPKDAMALALLKNLGEQIDQITPSIQRYQMLGDSFLKHGLFEKTWDMYKKIAEMDPQQLSNLSELALTFQQNGHESEAKKAYLYLAEQALAQDDLKQAYEIAQKAISLKSLEAGYILGLIHFKRKQWNEAKDEFEKLLRIKITHLGGLIHLAKTYVALNQPAKAQENFQKALKVDENNVLVQETWVDFCLQGPDKDLAIPHLTLLIDKAVANNQHGRTVKFSRMMVDLRPELTSARFKLIQALQALGDLQGAADALRALAFIYEQQGQLTEASQCIEKANELNPSYREAPRETPKKIDVDSASLLARRTAYAAPPQAPAPSPAPSIPEVPVTSYPIPGSLFDEMPDEEDFPIPPPAPPPKPQTQASYQPPHLEGVAAQLETADLCLEQGLLKAAIEVYQQILEKNPGLTDVRKKLGEVNAAYLKKFIETKQ
ncbi:MAG TPA: tetratricopeptide repeat protein [bacterium]|jgi:tetratricopeptide (TPR) repeat protein|nr:tetratricopeptide repeat protein [bacterium]